MRHVIKYFFVCISLSFTLVVKGQQSLKIQVRTSDIDTYVIESQNEFRDSADLFSQLNDFQFDYISKGHLLAGYDSLVLDSTGYSAYFSSSQIFTWGNIEFDGPEEFTQKYSGRLKNNRAADYAKLQDLLSEILADASKKGYPFAEIDFDTVRISDQSQISVVASLELGEMYYFDSVHVKSDTKIRQHYIETYLDIKEGDIFSISAINDIENKIGNLNYIELSRPFQLAFGENNADLLLYLKKKKANNFNGMIGILPNNKTTGKLLITGDVNLLLLNSLGAGEFFSFRWQKFEASSQNLNTEFSVPYLFKTKFGLGALFNIEKKDSTYLNTDFTGRIIFGNNTANGFELFFARSASFLLNSGDAINGMSDFKTNLFGTSYRFMKVDNYLAPRSGVLLKVRSSFGTKIFDDEDASEPLFQNKSKVDISYYIPVFNFMTVKFRSLTSMIYSSQIFDNELDLIGGLQTIRGFDELSLPVSSYSILNTEFRYIFEKTSALFVFYDLAYFEKRYTSLDSYNYAMGFGAGLDLQTNAGIFSIVFAVGKQNENAFAFNASKIHLGYKSSF